MAAQREHQKMTQAYFTMIWFAGVKQHRTHVHRPGLPWSFIHHKASNHLSDMSLMRIIVALTRPQM